MEVWAGAASMQEQLGEMQEEAPRLACELGRDVWERAHELSAMENSYLPAWGSDRDVRPDGSS